LWRFAFHFIVLTVSYMRITVLQVASVFWVQNIGALASSGMDTSEISASDFSSLGSDSKQQTSSDDTSDSLDQQSENDAKRSPISPDSHDPSEMSDSQQLSSNVASTSLDESSVADDNKPLNAGSSDSVDSSTDNSRVHDSHQTSSESIDSSEDPLLSVLDEGTANGAAKIEDLSRGDKPVENEQSGESTDSTVNNGGNEEKPLVQEMIPIADTKERFKEETKAHFDIVSSTEKELSELLSQLYGKAVTDFAKDAKGYEKEVLEIDCNDPKADLDPKLNIVTTLCPFLRDEEGACGAVRHSSFTVVDTVKLCSEECAKNIDAIMTALPRRKYLQRRPDRKHEASIFRAIVNTILLQYASECRVGTWLPN
jgi:hypothetical protein